MATLHNTVRRASIVSAASPSAHAFNTLSRTSLPQRTAHHFNPWGLQGHHHQRFMSTSTQLHNGFMKASPLSSIKATTGVSSRTLIAAGATTTCIFGPLIWARAFGSFRNVAHCAPATPSNPKLANIGQTPPYSTSRIPNDKDPLINSKELTFGAAMGLCSGYLFKKLGKMFVLVAGLGFVCLQLLANSGYVHVNWILIESRFKDKFDLDKDGKVTVNDAKHGFNWIIDLLTRNFQFKSTFAGGFYLGFRYG
ncbi:FUN14 family-domain-containing protein [Gamsiella multidivaricata]|uniref:FUN14 family-domain-containing protein n=1 Tax=Gamsiella multidivaricata TaxID=101098 RepID=UPI00221F6994|nr:FUN14 family-domain-containing protein [Gamsiella multidivaricata]KAI7824132.1 FUN14 family-domain-containing protein [Gamsiella multidivaricata]